MFCIRFFNKFGEIIFGGGMSNSIWKITACDGLSFSGKTIVGAKFAGQDGQETTSVTNNPRTITLAGDVLLDHHSRPLYQKALQILQEDGFLEIINAEQIRKIKARCCDFIEKDRKGKYLLYTIQFLCDNPFFEDSQKTIEGIFKVIPNLDSSFTFPGSFSNRISRKKFVYLGNAKCEPLFNIYIGDVDGGDNTLLISNHTSGEFLKFNFAEASNSIITVDVENRKIYNSLGENLLKYLSDDSFFDGFHLYPGENDIEVLNSNMNSGIEVSMSYSNKYSEAVYI